MARVNVKHLIAVVLGDDRADGGFTDAQIRKLTTLGGKGMTGPVIEGALKHDPELLRAVRNYVEAHEAIANAASYRAVLAGLSSSVTARAATPAPARATNTGAGPAPIASGGGGLNLTMSGSGLSMAGLAQTGTVASVTSGSETNWSPRGPFTISPEHQVNAPLYDELSAILRENPFEKIERRLAIYEGLGSKTTDAWLRQTYQVLRYFCLVQLERWDDAHAASQALGRDYSPDDIRLACSGGHTDSQTAWSCAGNDWSLTFPKEKQVLEHASIWSFTIGEAYVYQQRLGVIDSDGQVRDSTFANHLGSVISQLGHYCGDLAFRYDGPEVHYWNGAIAYLRGQMETVGAVLNHCQNRDNTLPDGPVVRERIKQRGYVLQIFEDTWKRPRRWGRLDGLIKGEYVGCGFGAFQGYYDESPVTLSDLPSRFKEHHQSIGGFKEHAVMSGFGFLRSGLGMAAYSYLFKKEELSGLEIAASIAIMAGTGAVASMLIAPVGVAGFIAHSLLTIGMMHVINKVVAHEEISFSKKEVLSALANIGIGAISEGLAARAVGLASEKTFLQLIAASPTLQGKVALGLGWTVLGAAVNLVGFWSGDKGAEKIGNLFTHSRVISNSAT